MTKITKKEFYVFCLPLLGFWALLLTIYLNRDFESSKVVPTLIYVICSGLTVYNIQKLITGSEYDPIVKNSRTRGLLVCLFISTLSILVEFSLEETTYLLPSIIIILSTVASFFLTGLFEYSNEQLEEKFLERSSERNLSIESRELWDLYLDELETNYINSNNIQKEIDRIRKILPFSSFFRGEKSKTILEQVEKIKNEDNLIAILKKYVK